MNKQPLTVDNVKNLEAETAQRWLSYSSEDKALYERNTNFTSQGSGTNPKAIWEQFNGVVVTAAAHELIDETFLDYILTATGRTFDPTINGGWAAGVETSRKMAISYIVKKLEALFG